MKDFYLGSKYLVWNPKETHSKMGLKKKKCSLQIQTVLQSRFYVPYQMLWQNYKADYFITFTLINK